MNVIADVYRAATNATQLEIQNRLVEEFRKLGVELSEDDLDELVIFTEVNKDDVKLAAIARSNQDTPHASTLVESEVTIKGSGGPIEAAKKTLGSLLERGTRTLHDVKVAVETIPPMRVAFGRWIGAAARNEYVGELHASWLKETGSARPAPLLSGSLSSLREIGEARGRVFDSTIEKGALAFLTTPEGLLALISDELDSPTLKEARRQFHERMSSRSTLLLMLIGIAPELAEDRLSQLAGVSAHVRDAARPLIAAFRAGDEAAAKEALSPFNVAVALDVIESTRKHHAERLRPLHPDS